MSYGKYVSQNEYLTNCPDCGKLKLYYNISKQVGWCHYCHKVWFKESGVYTEGNYEGEFRALSHRMLRYGESELAVSHEEARTFLEGRGMTDFEMAVNLVTYADGQVRFPVASPSPEYPVSLMKREIRKDGGWYFEGENKKRYSYGWEGIPKERSRVVLVEGIFDVFSPGLFGYAIAILGSRIDDVLMCHLEKNFHKVFVWMDADIAGRTASKEIMRSLHGAGIQAYEIESEKEPGDYPREDPLCEDLRAVLTGNKELSVDGAFLGNGRHTHEEFYS